MEKIGTEEEDEDDEEEEEEEEEDQKKKKAKKIKVEKNPLKFYFPTFLSKTSSTYFKTVNTSFLQKLSKTQRKKSSNVNVKKKVSRQASKYK